MKSRYSVFKSSGLRSKLLRELVIINACWGAGRYLDGSTNIVVPLQMSVAKITT